MAVLPDVKVSMGGRDDVYAELKDGRFGVRWGDVKIGSPGDAEPIWQPSDSACSTAAESWGEDEVAAWLLRLNKKAFQPYAEKVTENAITAEVLMESNDVSLQTDLEITNKHHRKRILTELKKLSTIKVCDSDLEDKQLQKTFQVVSKGIIAAAKSQNFTGGDVADRIWDALGEDGVHVDEHGQSVGGDLESMFSEISKNAIGLEALEWRIHGILKLRYSTDKQSPYKGLEDLLKLVMDAKRSLKVGFHNLRNGAGSLKTAISNFRRISRRSDTTSDEEEKERELLRTEFGNWQKQCQRVLQDIQSRTSELLVQTKKQASDVQGGEAVRIAYKKVPEIAGELEVLFKKRNAILQQGANGLESKTVTLAYDAYRFGLSQQTSMSEESRDRIKAKLEQLQAVGRSADGLEVATLREAFNIKDERQDWLSTFINSWRSKLDKITKNPTKAQEALDDAIAECEAKLLKYQKDVDDLKYAVDHHQWTLETSGFLPTEREISDKNKQLNHAKEIVSDAMVYSGVPDPLVTADALTKMQDVLLLVSAISDGTSQVVAQIQGWTDNFNNLLERMKGKAKADGQFLMQVLPIVEKSINVIARTYHNHINEISTGGARYQIIGSYVAKMLPARTEL